MIETKNAIVRKARITNADHGLLTVWLDLDYGGSGQGFGGYNLHVPESWKTGGNFAGHFIWRVLEVCGVDSWDKIPGKTIRVQAEWGKVHAIGHIIKDDWFSPSEDFKE